jgi:5-methylcytosine-specific restriction protein A
MPTRAPALRPAGWKPPQRAAWDHGGLTAHARGYGAHWQRLRAVVLGREPLCRPCSQRGKTTAATQVDHVTPKARGGTDDDQNLQPICAACHAAKTRDERGGGR